ncbi:hypothetical protein CALCODRAFT_513390 [Calocera cornea HHB12733]|uniref:Uncharacterized protein n=1 Tax=Calocera cornea HHB12733 TaxID=1353952 RepID=A0A165C5Q9_9BASI|nr:hypothetical protein CALCODRAFT_513390 [Calocera cornea HHB12733]
MPGSLQCILSHGEDAQPWNSSCFGSDASDLELDNFSDMASLTEDDWEEERRTLYGSGALLDASRRMMERGWTRAEKGLGRSVGYQGDSCQTVASCTCPGSTIYAAIDCIIQSDEESKSDKDAQPRPYIDAHQPKPVIKPCALERAEQAAQERAAWSGHVQHLEKLVTTHGHSALSSNLQHCRAHALLVYYQFHLKGKKKIQALQLAAEFSGWLKIWGGRLIQTWAASYEEDRQLPTSAQERNLPRDAKGACSIS